ncbi:DNA ligase [Desulfitispora alkaliphila]|uniref:ATP-dependent DNA ligase n=1 Tax=Desulfitispora alkaliphila TaxID=622674 RepID=UPI003D24D267
MEPKLLDKPFDSQDYLFQLKWDGVRCLAKSKLDSQELYSRRGNRRTSRYPELSEALKKLTPKGVILDGEIVSLNQNGKPDFKQVLRRDLAVNKSTVNALMREISVTYIVFDILELEGKVLTEATLNERLELLHSVIPANSRLISPIQSIATEGISMYQAVSAEGLEGIVAKKKDSPYLLGKKSDYWYKIKVWQEIDATAGGFIMSEGQVRSLLLGHIDEANARLIYIGNASSGLDQEKRQQIVAYSSLHKSEFSPFYNQPSVKLKPGHSIHWLQSPLPVTVRFLEWTSDNKLRHPSIKQIKITD